LECPLRDRTSAAAEAERPAQRGSEFGQHFADRITNRGCAAARVEKRHWIVLAVIGDDQRPRVAARTERAAIDHNLVGVRDDKLLALVAALLVGTPMSSMDPVESIWPARSCATAASTLELSAAAPVKSATTVEILQLLSISPGWEMSSPAEAESLRASTWLLLRIYWLVPSVIRAPRVPLQQNRLLASLTFTA